MVKKLIVAAVVAAIPVLGVTAPADAAPKKPGHDVVVLAAIDWH
ncbi:hypothetical protein [Aeromicrobium alkaliterrae]|uniref:Acid phosphatase n=1 Tax=Aeromicrobium alkaliterrae TaxID=302168 RepID=A0ABN2JHK0_9ACTN